MSSVFDDDSVTFHVVVNDEEQYSIWPEYMDIPAGWQMTEMTGSRHECLDYIDREWTDMRPLSLRRQMDGSSSTS